MESIASVPNTTFLTPSNGSWASPGRGEKKTVAGSMTESHLFPWLALHGCFHPRNKSIKRHTRPDRQPWSRGKHHHRFDPVRISYSKFVGLLWTAVCSSFVLFFFSSHINGSCQKCTDENVWSGARLKALYLLSQSCQKLLCEWHHSGKKRKHLSFPNIKTRIQGEGEVTSCSLSLFSWEINFVKGDKSLEKSL